MGITNKMQMILAGDHQSLVASSIYWGMINFCAVAIQLDIYFVVKLASCLLVLLV